MRHRRGARALRSNSGNQHGSSSQPLPHCCTLPLPGRHRAGRLHARLPLAAARLLPAPGGGRPPGGGADGLATGRREGLGAAVGMAHASAPCVACKQRGMLTYVHPLARHAACALPAPPPLPRSRRATTWRRRCSRCRAAGGPWTPRTRRVLRALPAWLCCGAFSCGPRRCLCSMWPMWCLPCPPLARHAAERPRRCSPAPPSAAAQIRESIKSLFPDRDCFTLVRPCSSAAPALHACMLARARREHEHAGSGVVLRAHAALLSRHRRRQ